LYNQSEFGNLENYLLEKKHHTKNSCEHVLDTYIFSGAVELKKYRFKKLSLFLINNFNEKVLEITSKVFFLLCIVITLVTTVYFVGNGISDWLYVLGLTLSLFPLIISLFIHNVLEYYHDTFCKKCGNKLACEEIGEPVIKETSNFGDYTLTITRHWKCRYCGNVDTREGKENIFTEQGEVLPVVFHEGLECRKCSGIGTVMELKKPDIKEIGKRRLIRRYYKCTLCGHEDIHENEEMINRCIHIG
jgi:hypothetical protein